MSYDYKEKYLWDIPVVWGKPDNGERELVSLRIRTPRIASKDCDVEAIIESEMGRQMVIQFEDFIRFGDEMDPELVEKWKNYDKGVLKQMHQRESWTDRWVTYTPMSAFKEENRDRKYPMIFVLHGGGMPINWEECSGFIPIAAREEIILCIPQNHDVENLKRLYKVMIEEYPVDPSRIYSTGYSQGSMQTNALLFDSPELLAAVAPCGCLAGPFKGYMPENGKEDIVAKLRVPTFIMSGQQEGLYLYPYYEDGKNDCMYDPNYTTPNIDVLMPKTRGEKLTLPAPDVDFKLESLNLRLRASNCKEITRDQITACKDSENVVERKIGMPFDKTEVKNIFGWDHYIGTVTDKYGDDYLKIVAVENFPHWPIPSMAEMAWDFLKHFSRDVLTKQLIDDRK